MRNFFHKSGKVFTLLCILLLLTLLAASLSLAAPLATTNLVLGSGYAASSGLASSTTQQYQGNGAWYELYPSAKTDMYIDPAATLGGTFTIDQIQSVSYHTVNGATNPSGVDFYVAFYTKPDGTCTTTPDNWYCHRLVGEPLYSYGYVAPTAWAWNTWSTNTGSNQLGFNDSNRSGNLGFYNEPTLQQIQAGAIDWSTYIGTGSATPVDYGPENVLYISFQTGSDWSAFEGYLDAITIELTTGTTYQIDLEDITSPVYVDDDWTGSAVGAEVATGMFYGWNAFATIQDGIDNVAVSGTVNVYPGTYSETAANRKLYDSSGPYQFGLFFGAGKDGITVRGVDTSGNPITSYSGVLATVNTNATNSFGTSGTFVEANNITLQGLKFGPNTSGDNKTIEVIGDNFTLLHSVTNIPGGGGSVYLNDWRYDSGTNTSYLQSYWVEGNSFPDGTSIDIASGAGYSGSVSGRKILNNAFALPAGSFWPAISFNGSNTGVPWFTYSVGGAVITGNQFSGGEQYIRARGTYDNSQFDWATYWNGNTYNKAVVVTTDGNPANVRTYSYVGGYGTINDIRRIGATIDQTHSSGCADNDCNGEIDHAQTGDTVLVKDGVYEEQVVVDNKTLTIKGTSLGAVIKAPTTVPTCFTTSSDKKPVVCIKNSADVTLDTLTIDGAGRGNSNYGFIGVALRNSAGTVENSTIKDIRDTPFSGAQHGVGIYAYNDDLTSRTINVWNNTLTGFQKNGMALNAGDTTPLIVDVYGNIVTGAGPTDITAQNGIQVGADLGSGNVTHNTISGIAYDNTLASTKWVATSILNQYADLYITENTISGAHMGIYNIDGASHIDLNNLTINKVGVYAWGIDATDPPEAVPAPYGAEDLEAKGFVSGSKVVPNGPTATTLTLSISDNVVTFSGGDNTATFGIEADSGYGPDDLNVTANHNTVTGFEVGIELYKCETDCDTGVFTSLVATDNCLSGNIFGMRSNETSVITDGRNNWWGSVTGPYNATSNPAGLGDDVSANINFVPWLNSCDGVSTGNFKNVQTGVFYPTLQAAVDAALAGQTVLPVTPGPWAGSTTVNTSGVTIDLNNATFTGGSPFLIVNADDVTVLGPGIVDGGLDVFEPGIQVNGGADNFILENVEIKGWGDGVNLDGAHESLKIVGNWIHSNMGNGIQFNSDIALTGVVTIQGNLFKANGGHGMANFSTTWITATYNSWGADTGPTHATNPSGTGQAVSDYVSFTPWTFSEIYIDLDPASSGDQYERRVAKTNSFDVAVMGDAENLYGLSFKFSYDSAKLTLNPTLTSFSYPWTSGNCIALPSLPTGQVGYYCSLTSGIEWDGGAIASFNFTANVAGESFFDVFTDSSLSSGATGGVKVFVNNAGYNAPSTPDRNITDTNDGKLIIDDIANFTGFIDLQGRANDSGAALSVYDTVSGTTLLATAASASSGKYTTVYQPGKWMVVSIPPSYSVPYYLYIDRALYLPTYTPYVNALLTSSPTTSLSTLLLLGGDGTDNNTIDVLDASCIGYVYGTSGTACSGGPGANSDVNGDGTVNIFDLTLMGGNYGQNTSPWVP